MKFLLIVAAAFAMAVASPARHLPIIPAPGIVGDYEPIHIGPAVIDNYEPIHVGPAIVDFPVPESALAPTPVAPPPSSSPLVQIIVNVNQQAEQTVPGEVIMPTPVEIVEDEEIIPTPVEVVEEGDQVIVVDEVHVDPEPVLVAPIIVAPAVVEPETLN